MGSSVRAAEDVREEVGTPSFTPASLFVELVLPMLPAQHTTSHLRKGSHTALRISLHFIVITVMNVMSGAFPDTYGVLP